ncbi:sensor histidine kinase [Flocculibacter collagenilyticus]|uniref:sensor histidine kinase n=1 Tax=Flocculibacter collagenilyticus TaxID=2744479 RepID=UPI0018F6183D|nr:histidine kinase [Flocculibacter collagenilyticus]
MNNFLSQLPSFSRTLFCADIKFWLLQLLGWIPFFLFQFALIGNVPLLAEENIVFASLATTFAIFGSLFLRLIYKKDTALRVNRYPHIIVVPLASLAIALGADLLLNQSLLGLSLFSERLASVGNLQPAWSNAPFMFLSYLIWSILYLLITKQRHLQAAIRERQDMTLALRESQIKNLENQLNPHFMFNTINNIRALILVDGERARDSLSKFADIMRAQINYEGNASITLKDELQFVRDYMDLMLLQFGKRLEYHEQIDDELLTQTVPRLSLHLLVENAIKHGVIPTNEAGKLAVYVGYAKNGWYIATRNKGTLNIDKSSSGIGLTNLQQRLQYQFGEGCQFKIYQQGDEVVSRIDFYHNNLAQAV